MNTVIDVLGSLWNALGCVGDTPIPQPKADAPITGPTKLISTPILGGPHHRYHQMAP